MKRAWSHARRRLRPIGRLGRSLPQGPWPFSAELPEPANHLCQECVDLGDRWVHLRLGLECGHIGCCDSSKNRHATAHYRHTGHRLIRGIEPGERWVWCFEDEPAIQL